MAGWLVGPGGGAAVLAGLCWMSKAVLILVTGDQPAFLFEAAFLLFPVAVVGLFATLPGGFGGRDGVAVAGLGLAVLTEAAAVGLAVALRLGPAAWVPREDTVTVLTPLYVLAGVGSFVALGLVGLAVRRRHTLPGRARSLPLTTALAALPLLALGGLLGLLHDRLVEVPVAVLGVAWVGIGFALARWWAADRSSRARPRRPSTAP